MMTVINRIFKLTLLFSSLGVAVLHGATPLSVDVELPTLTLEEAIAITLKNQRTIQISQMFIAEQRGEITNSAGPFDIVMDGNLDYFARNDRQKFSADLKSDQAAHELLGTISYNKQMRIGTRFNLFAEADQIVDPFGYFVGEVPAKKSTSGILSFTIEQPLLRGFLNGNDAIIERANRRELTAVVLDNLHVISQSIDATAEQYWEAITAQEILKIRDETVKRFEALLKNTEILIKNEELAKSDILQPQSQLGTSKLTQILARQRLYAAVQTLLFQLGVADEGTSFKMEGKIHQTFPDIPEDLPISIEFAEYLINYAIGHRYDIRAARVRESVADILIQGGYNDLLPQLDVIFNINRHDFRAGERNFNPFYRSLNMPHPQKDYLIGLRLSIPMCNSAAKGTLYKRKAIRQRLGLETQQLIQGAYEEILNAWSNLIAISHSLKENAYVLKKNQELVTNEQRKLKEGFTTLFILIDFENKLTDSLIARAELMGEFMKGIAKLRYLTGSIITSDESLWCFTIEDIYRLFHDRQLSIKGEK